MQLKCKVGIDLVYMPRYLNKLDDSKFLNKILTHNELKLYEKLNNDNKKLEFLCGRFACKEAYAKALKVGIGKVDFYDFEVLKDNNGAPYCPNIEVDISISHDNDYTIAVVMLGDENE